MASIYIDFDSLFDTRIALIESIDKKAARTIVQKEKYFTRPDDKFWLLDPRLTEQKFTKAWGKRGEVTDRSLLMMTMMPFKLYQEQQDKALDRANGIVVEDDKLIINSYPYALSKPEKDFMAQELMAMTQIKEILFINQLPDTITPTQIAKWGLRLMIVYDFDLWLNLHYKELANNSIFNVQVVTPLLLKGSALMGTTISGLVEKAKKELGPFLNYEPQPISEFCFMTDQI
jgi:hypothetical protein